MWMLQIGRFTIAKPFVLAPMAGVSQMPFRRIALQHGAGLAPTELVSAKGLFFESQRTKSYLAYDQAVEVPFCVQLFGGEAPSMAVAAEKAMVMGADIIDINMGCPVKKVTKINAGSALLCDYQRAAAIVEAMQKRTGGKIPITAKLRSGWDSNQLNFLEVGKALEEAGIAVIALHARTRAQGYSGKANWQHIAELKAHLKIPVIGNGDIENRADADRMFRETGCDAVMIGRAALGNPWLFRELAGDDTPVTVGERLALIKEHLSSHIALQALIADDVKLAFNERMAVTSFRNHLIWYSKGLKDSAQFRQNIMSTESHTTTMAMIDDFFGAAQFGRVKLGDDDDGIDYRQAFG